MLDGLRAVAVFLVIFYHAGLPSPGGLGVLIFFVISGFLITWLLLGEYDRRGNVSLSQFYIRRSLRIFPAFYTFAAILITVLLIRHKPVLWSQAVAALLYYNNYYQALLGDPNTGFSHTWSLAVEEQFYLLWPAVFFIWKHQFKKLQTVLIMAILGIWIYRAVLQFALHVNQRYMYEAFDCRADHLLIGCLLAIALWTSGSDVRWRAVSGLWQLALTVCGLVGSVLLEMRFQSGYRDSIGFLINPVLTALLIVQLITCRDRTAVAWMQTAPVRYLGRISYSLYLYQQLVLPTVEKALGAYPAAIRIPVAVLAVMVAATASFYLVEMPFLRLKARFNRVAVAPRDARPWFGFNASPGALARLGLSGR